MKTLIIYGSKFCWINFESDCLLPYFNNYIQSIKIFTKTDDILNYLESNQHQINYVMPLDENHMIELRNVGIEGLFPPAETVDIFCNKQKFANYVLEHNLSNYFPITYTSQQKSEQLVVVKPNYGGASTNVYVTTLDKLTPDIFINNVVQEYIDSKTEFAGYFVAKNGKIVHSFAYYRKYPSVPYIKAINDNTIQKRTHIDNNYLEIIEKFIRPISFTGTFCVDFKLAKNTLIVLEINARLGGSLSYPENIQDAVNIISHMIKVYN
jgi:predicted ATP-grasp superfamily ATP-dependent carboligase